MLSYCVVSQTRADRITRTGVIEPYPALRMDPTRIAQQVLQQFLAAGAANQPGVGLPHGPPPEEVAAKAYRIAQWEAQGIRMPVGTNVGLMKAAAALRNGESVTVKSQGREVVITPNGEITNKGFVR